MSKVILNDVTAGFASSAAVNANSSTIEAAFENTLSRDGSSPNHMNANIDMNGFSIINLGNPISVGGINWEGPWLTSTVYAVGDAVNNGGTSYIAIVEHTSGTFDLDLAASYWQVLAEANLPDQTGHSTEFLTTDGSSASWSGINFTQVGTGAVTRTVQNKNEDLVSVKDFGAVGDGVTNDTAAFNAAIAAASGNTVEVLVPAGTYKLTTAVDVQGKDVRYIADSSTTFSAFENLSGTLSRPQRISRDTFGILDQGAGYAVMCHTADAGAQVNGFSSDSALASYEDRDSVGLYVQNTAPARFFTTTGTTYTATTVVSTTGATVAKLKIGMIIDTLHSPKYSGRLTGFSTDGKTLTVSGWYKQGDTSAGQVPPNGTHAVVNKTTKVWAHNANVTIETTSDADKATGFELGVVPNKAAWTLGSTNTTWGFDCNNLGTYRAEVAFIQRGDFYYGYSSRGAYRAAYHIKSASQNPNYGLFVEAPVDAPIMCAPSGVQTYALHDDGAMEIGSISASSTIPLDFHTSGLAADYDSRILATGGTSTNGKGTLQFSAANIDLQGLTTTTTAPSAGGAGALPATPAGYITILVDGVARQLPYY